MYAAIKNWVKIHPHKHSGKLMPHEHTSYPLLGFLILITGLLLCATTLNVGAADQNYTVSGTVLAPAPGAPTLSISGSPQVGQTVNASGSCAANTLVEVFSNGVLVGAAICDQNRTYHIPISLFVGDNSLTAKAVDAADQESPESAAVHLAVAIPSQGGSVLGGPVLSQANAPNNQLFLRTQVFHRGIEPGQALSWNLDVQGGTPPYAVSAAWGDGDTDLYSRGANGAFDARHTYSKVGQGYRGSIPVIFKATDASGASAYLQVVAIVTNGTAATSKSKSGLPSGIAMAWPLLGVAALMTVTFFLGEWREKRLLKPSSGVTA